MLNGAKAKSKSGNCTSNNLIYCYFCTICNKPYVGRTVTRLNVRTNKHRSAYYKVLSVAKSENPDIDSLEADDDDTYSLGLHLFKDHNCTEHGDFNRLYRVFIADFCSPSDLEVIEHKYMHKLKSFRPLGLNKANPFNIPLLDNVYVNYTAS